MDPIRLALLIYELIAGQRTLASFLRVIESDLTNVAREHEPYAVQTTAANAANTVNHPQWGNAALRTLILDISPPIPDRWNEVLNAIAALPAGSNLPPVGTADAEAVWTYTWDSVNQQGAQLARLFQWWQHYNVAGALLMRGNPWFGVWWPVSTID